MEAQPAWTLWAWGAAPLAPVRVQQVLLEDLQAPLCSPRGPKPAFAFKTKTGALTRQALALHQPNLPATGSAPFPKA